MTLQSGSDMVSASSSLIARAPHLGFIAMAKLARRSIKPLHTSPPPNHTPSNLIFHEERKVLLVVPKVASRTLLAAFAESNLPGVERGPDVPLDFCKTLQGYEVGAVVRNPVDRALSCYEDKIARLDIKFARTKRISRYPNLNAFMSAQKFAEWLNSNDGNDERADVHWASQHLIVQNYIGTPAASKFFQLESMNNDFDPLCEWLGVQPLKIKHLNKMHSPAEARRAVIDKEIHALLTQRYAKDMDLFGYSS